jgi:hypothetical protein
MYVEYQASTNQSTLIKRIRVFADVNNCKSDPGRKNNNNNLIFIVYLLTQQPGIQLKKEHAQVEKQIRQRKTKKEQ